MNGALDPSWVSLILGLVGAIIGSAVTGAIAYAALKSWMARREVHEKYLRQEVDDHEVRLRMLERHPLDYPVR